MSRVPEEAGADGRPCGVGGLRFETNMKEKVQQHCSQQKDSSEKYEERGRERWEVMQNMQQ